MLSALCLCIHVVLNFPPSCQVNQLNQLIELTRSELKRDDRQRIMSLITMDAHARDVVLMLIREGVTDKVLVDLYCYYTLKKKLDTRSSALAPDSTLVTPISTHPQGTL